MAQVRKPRSLKETPDRKQPKPVGESSCRLVMVADGLKKVFPPGRPVVLKGQTDVLGFLDKPVVVVGEPGSGTSRLVDWIRDLLKGQDPEAFALDLQLLPQNIILHGQAEEFQRLEEFLTLRKVKKSKCKFLLKDANHPGGLGAALVDALTHLEEELPQKGPPVLVVVEDLSDFEGLPSFLAALRGALENRDFSRMRFVIIGRDERLFDTEPYSAFLKVARMYRTSFLTRSECEILWRQKRSGTLQGDPKEIAKACLHWTGGHPLLATQYLEHVKDGKPVEEAGRLLTSQRHYALPQWQSNLKGLLTARQRLVPVLERYLGGRLEPAGSVNDAILPLFLSGWIRYDDDERVWRITSACHVDWAQEVLDRMERGGRR